MSVMRSGLRHHGRPGLQAQNQVNTVKTTAIASEIGTAFVKVSPTLTINPHTSSFILLAAFCGLARLCVLGWRALCQYMVSRMPVNRRSMKNCALRGASFADCETELRSL